MLVLIEFDTRALVRLCVFRFQAPDLEVQLSDEIPGSLRLLRVSPSHKPPFQTPPFHAPPFLTVSSQITV